MLISYVAGSQLHSYILLIPFVSAYLLYFGEINYRRITCPIFQLRAYALAAVSASVAFTYWIQFAGWAPANNDRIVLVTLSFLCCLAAGGFFFLGRDWMKAAAFRLPTSFSWCRCQTQWQMRSRWLLKLPPPKSANVLFHLSGTPFLREGPIFQLPNITIEVAQECSGIRSSWVLFMTSILAGNLFLKTPWRRFALIAFVIPLGILRNGFRILVIGLLCVNVGPQMIHSLIHRRGGPVFFTLSLIPFLVVLWWLRKGDVRIRQQK